MKFAVLFSALILFCTAAVEAQPNWVLQPRATDNDLVAVFFTSSERGWIAGDDGYLASTSDGGKSWTKYPLNATEDINEIYFRNEKNGYLVAGRKMFLTNDGGNTWQAINRGLRSEGIPDPDAEVGHCVHRIAMHRSRPRVLFMQKHWDVMRTDDGGD